MTPQPNVADLLSQVLLITLGGLCVTFVTILVRIIIFVWRAQ